jgi:FkbM family methyltransferase
VSKPIFHNGNILIKRCKHGFFAYNQFDNMVGLSLDLYGEWCDEELDFFKEVINPGDVILDVGAFIGTHTIFFAQEVGPLGKVLAFEPQRSSFQMLCTNLTLNAIYNTHCFQVGLSDTTGQLKLPVVDPYQGRNYGGIPIEGYNEGENLALIPVDLLDLKQCNHIKIDVEGMESKVLKGAKKTIARCRPILYVENNTVEESTEILQTLNDLGYDCWWHFIPYYNPKNFFKSDENVFEHYKRAFEANLACFPKELKITPKNLIPVKGVKDNWEKASKRKKK